MHTNFLRTLKFFAKIYAHLFCKLYEIKELDLFICLLSLELDFI